MERVRELIAPAHLLDGISEDDFRRLMHEETIIVEFEPARAKRALPRLLRSAADRAHAHELLDAMVRHARLDERQLALVSELRGLLPAPGARGTQAAPAAAPKGATRSTKLTRSTPRRRVRA
jgi:hypothetical protein